VDVAVEKREMGRKKTSSQKKNVASIASKKREQ
jgi:hypothetical protein